MAFSPTKGNFNCYWLDDSVDTDNADSISFGVGIVCIIKKGTPTVYRVGFEAVSLGLSDIVSASCGLDHVALRDIHGTVYCYGNNQHGQCGEAGEGYNKEHGFVLSRSTKLVCCGATSTLIVCSSGAFEAVGRNEYSQLGDIEIDSGRRTQLFTEPIQLISSGYAHTCIIAGDILYGSGSNTHGQLSFLTDDLVQKGFKPWTDSFTLRSVACGHWNTALITNKGELFVAGKAPPFQGEPMALNRIREQWKKRYSREFKQIGAWKQIPLPEPASEVKIGSSLALVLALNRKTIFFLDLCEVSILRTVRVEDDIKSFTVAGRNWAFT